MSKNEYLDEGDDEEQDEDEDDGDAKEWTQTSNAMYLTYLYPDFQNKGFKMRDEPEMLFQMLYYVF